VFKLKHKYNALYALVAMVGAIAIAYLQGSRSIVLVGCALIYAPLLHIALYRLGDALKLPMTIEVAQPYVQKIDLHDNHEQR